MIRRDEVTCNNCGNKLIVDFKGADDGHILCRNYKGDFTMRMREISTEELKEKTVIECLVCKKNPCCCKDSARITVFDRRDTKEILQLNLEEYEVGEIK